MKRKWICMALCVVLTLTLLGSATGASAASGIITMYKTTVADGRLREGPSPDYNVARTLRQGEKVFYSGTTSASFALVRTTSGEMGYIYTGFLTPYGNVRADQLYSANSTVTVYRSPSTSASRTGTLSGGEAVLVFAVSGNWAFVKTFSGVTGFASLSGLTSVM